MTVREAIREIAGLLEEAGCPSPRVDAEWLVAHVIGGRRTDLYVDDRPLREEELVRLRIARRAEANDGSRLRTCSASGGSGA